MDNSIHIPLDLPDVRVLEVSKTDQGHWLIRIESTLSGTTCHQCGRQLTHFHGFDHAIRLRHLPVFDTPVFVEFRPKRYQCHHCEGKPTTTQRLSWHELRSPNTKPYENWLLRMLVNSTVADVARKLEISDETVTGVLDRWVTTQVNWDEFERIEIVGLDEIALKRGHRDYVVLVTAPLAPRGIEVLAVLGDRKQQTVANFFASIPAGLRGTIKRLCKQAYILREELTEIFERHYTKAGAKCAIRAWCKRVRQSGIKEFDSFLKTVETWLDKITNYFLEGLTSGFVEGFNNRVKVLKRRCYGIFDVDQIFQRLTLDINGYERFGLT